MKNKTRIGLLFATKIEAMAFIKTMNLVEEKPLLHYQDEHYDVIIFGMGHLLSEEELQYIAGLQLKEFWNLGVCGSLNKNLKIFQVCCPHQIMLESEYMERSQILSCNRDLQAHTITLMTVTTPLHGGKRREKVAKFADLVDMEAYHLLLSLKKIGVSCKILKCISDDCLEGGSETIRRNLPQAADIIQKALVGIVGVNE